MKYVELINELCDVIKGAEVNGVLIYSNCEFMQNLLKESDLPDEDKQKMSEKISEILATLQHQDLHRQKIERVVNYVCDKNGIDKSQYNFADSAKSINSENNVSEDELEALIKQMQS